MRIAVFHDLPSGGAKRTLYELTRRLAARHTIDVYALDTADHRFCDVRPLVATHHAIAYTPSPLYSSPFGRLNQVQRWHDLGRLAELGQRLGARIDGEGYDVVVAEPSRWTQAPPLLAALRTPSIYDLHEPPRALYDPQLNERAAPVWRRALDRLDPLPPAYRARARRLDRQATRAATRVLAHSRFTAQQVRRLYAVEPQVVYHGVDVERFRPLPDVTRRDEVLSVGALQPSKGYEFLLQALAKLPQSGRPALRIVGNTERAGERAFLVAQAARLGVRLEIEVGIEDDQLVRRYAEAALLLYAPHAEPFGLAALEAMACATPVVAVAEGGVMESVVHEETGLLVSRDLDQFADAVRRVLRNPAARARLGANGRDAVCAGWTWDRTMAHLEAALERVARGGARGAPA